MAESLPRASLFRWAVRHSTWLALFLFCLGLHFGLSWAQSRISPAARKKESIATYTATRPKQRTLGAIAIVRPYGWFFKISGPDELVGSKKEALAEFVKSIQFSDQPDVDPTWTLPEGWKQQEGNEQRFATIQIGTSDAPLELTVTRLAMRFPDETEFLLANVNRWRSQELGLEPLTAEDLPKKTTTLKSGPVDITLVDASAYLDGSPAKGNMYVRTMEELEELARMRGEEPPPPEITFTLPKGWKEAPAGQFQTARFTVGGGENPVEVSISLAGGDLTANINRWCDQIGLERLTEEQIAATIRPTEVSGLSAFSITLVGPEGPKQEAILGVIAPSGNRTWFIKLRGPAQPAQEQKKNFDDFVKSLKLE